LAIPLQIFIIRRVRQRITLLNLRVQQSGESFSERVVEFISGMRATKSMGNEELVAGQMTHTIHSRLR
jgi:ABC-type multidrug transport system fused ATPase/permease subunit